MKQEKKEKEERRRGKACPVMAEELGVAQLHHGRISLL